MSDAMPNLQRPVALQLNNIHKNFGSLEVLKGVSLTAYDGDVISILGPPCCAVLIYWKTRRKGKYF